MLCETTLSAEGCVVVAIAHCLVGHWTRHYPIMPVPIGVSVETLRALESMTRATPASRVDAALHA